MKKIYFILIFIFVGKVALSQVQTINVGTTANDGTGDPLRVAFIKVNQNFTYLQAQMALKASLNSPTFTGTVVLPSTTSIGNVSSTEISYLNNTRKNIQEQLDDTLTFTSIGWLKSDTSEMGSGTRLATKHDLSELTLGGGSSIKKLQFVVGVTTNAPNNGDSILTHSEFTVKHIEVYRDGARQYYNSGDVNSYDGFRHSNDTIVVNPVFATYEQVIVEVTNDDAWTNLTLESESLGSELVTNGNFSSSDGWTIDEDASISGGELVINSTKLYEAMAYRTDIDIDIGETYKISFTITNYSSGSVYIDFDDAGYTDPYNANGTYVIYLDALANSSWIAVRVGASGNNNLHIDDLSVRKVL